MNLKLKSKTGSGHVTVTSLTDLVIDVDYYDFRETILLWIAIKKADDKLKKEMKITYDHLDYLSLYGISLDR
jgi:hypothetical protein